MGASVAPRRRPRPRHDRLLGSPPALNFTSASFTVLAGLLLLMLPRRFAAIPLLLGAAYVTRGAAIELGPATLSVFRILIAVGAVRVMIRGERIANGLSSIDRLMLLWAICLLGTSAFHEAHTWVFRAGIIWSDLGAYFLFRVFLQDYEDVVRTFKALCVLLLPVAALMLLEKSSGENLFTAVGGAMDVSMRDGHSRARGPFVHAILAGTVGATCLPIALALWRRHRRYASLGLLAAIGMVFASTSSGPIIMSVVIVLALLLWPFRERLRAIRWSLVFAIVALDFVMKDPVYFLMARIDITGGSKGWHRAQLIRSSLEHIDEWWLAGTDHTRHWMPTGIDANELHTDITNHFLAAGVMGGLPLLLLLVITLVVAFRTVGRALRQHAGAPFEHRFMIWTLGAIVFGHVVNFFSISLFDQSIVFFYLILAGIDAVHHPKRLAASRTATRVGASSPLRRV
jgi:hypothetical protein